MFDWSSYTGSLTWLRDRTIYLTRHGSHAYGTNLPSSDLDIRGIFIAPKEHYFGIGQRCEQASQAEPDLTIFELRKFLKLAADCNPNAMELLFTDDSDHLLKHPISAPLFENRHLFLSREVKNTFSGYAVSQLKRINTHYRWLKNPPTKAPTRAEFELPERTVIPADQLAAANAAIRKQQDQWEWHGLDVLDPGTRQAIQDEFYRRLVEITQWSWEQTSDKVWEAAAKTLGYDTNFIELLDRERRYTGRLREWQQYQTWQKERNPDRAALEAKHGFDTKHALHLVRLLRMCREIITEGKVLVRRPDAPELLAIRAGAWSYFQLVSWAEQQDAELKELVKTSPLPKKANIDAINLICVQMTEEFLRAA